MIPVRILGVFVCCNIRIHDCLYHRMNHTDIGDFDNNGQFMVVDVAVSVCQQLLLDVGNGG